MAFTSFSQRHEIDSLNILISKSNTPDTNRVRLLNVQAFNYHLIKPDSTIILSKLGYQLAIQLNDRQGIADALKHWAIAEYMTSNQNFAIEKNIRALHIYKQIGDLKGQGAVLNNLAIIHHNKGEFEQAEKYYKQSLAIRIKIKDAKGEADCYNNIGNLNTDLGNYSESLFYLLKALECREKIGEEFSIANSYGNIASVYILMGKYDQGMSYAQKALDLDRKNGNNDGIYQGILLIGNIYHFKHESKRAIDSYLEALRISNEMKNENARAVCLIDLGKEYLTTKNYEKAEGIFSEALIISDMQNDKTGIALCKGSLGEVYLKTNRSKMGIVSLKEALEVGLKIGGKQIIYDASSKLADASERLGNMVDAVKYYKQSISYKDSLNNDEAKKKIQEVEYNYNLDKKQNQIILLEKDKSIRKYEVERQRIVTIALVIGIVLLLLVIVILVRNGLKEQSSLKLIKKQKIEIEEQAKSLEELNNVKDKIFSVLAHDLRSPVTSLLGVVNLLEEELLTQSEFLQLRDSFSEQIKSLSLLLDNLLNWSRSHIQSGLMPHKVEVNLWHKSQAIKQVFKQIAAQKGIEIVVEINPEINLQIDPDHLDILLRNMISNAIKYSFKNSQIVLKVKIESGNVFIIIKDSGVGMAAAQVSNLFKENANKSTYGTNGEKGTGIGLLLCNEFVELNGGRIEVISAQNLGTTFNISVPI